MRAHWFALPVLRVLEAANAGTGVIEVRLDEGDFHLHVGAEDGPVHGDGPAPGDADARLAMDTATCTAISRGGLGLVDAVRDGRITVTGDGTLAKALRES